MQQFLSDREQPAIDSGYVRGGDGDQSALVKIAPLKIGEINPVHNTSFLGKVDHQVTRSVVFTLRYSLCNVNSNNSRGAGALNAVTASAGLDNTDQMVAAPNILTLSPRTVNETRAQYTRSNLAALPTDLIGPAVSIAGVAAFGTLSGSPTGRINNLYELVDNISNQAGLTHFGQAWISFIST